MRSVQHPHSALKWIFTLRASNHLFKKERALSKKIRAYLNKVVAEKTKVPTPERFLRVYRAWLQF